MERKKINMINMINRLNRFRFGQALGPETLHREYKEFTIPAHLLTQKFSHQTLIDLCHTGKWTFNDLVKRAILSYFDQYHEKYKHAFCNPASGTEGGELWIGVDDTGDVHGIPFVGDLAAQIELPQDAETVMEWFPIEYTPQDACPTPSKRLQHYLKEEANSSRLLREHQMSYTKWRSEFNVYTRKLKALFDDDTTKHQFFDYVRKKSPETFREISLPHFRMEQKRYMDIRHFVERKEGVYYWMCQWKDMKLRELRLRKPPKVSKKHLHRSTRYGPKRILSKVREMIPLWMSQNEGLRLYVLKMTFSPGAEHSSAWKRALIVKHGKTTAEPCCIPLATPSDKSESTE